MIYHKNESFKRNSSLKESTKMCNNFHKGSYLDLVTTSLEKMIEHDPKKVGLVEFDKPISGKLNHLDEDPQMETLLNEGVGATVSWLVIRFKLPPEIKILGSVYDQPITPRRYAELLIQMTQIISPRIWFMFIHKKENKDNEIFYLNPPKDKTDLGAKKVYFKLLLAVLEFSLNNMVKARQRRRTLQKRIKDLKQLLKLAHTKKPKDGMVH